MGQVAPKVGLVDQKDDRVVPKAGLVLGEAQANSVRRVAVKGARKRGRNVVVVIAVHKDWVVVKWDRLADQKVDLVVGQKAEVVRKGRKLVGQSGALKVVPKAAGEARWVRLGVDLAKVPIADLVHQATVILMARWHAVPNEVVVTSVRVGEPALGLGVSGDRRWVRRHGAWNRVVGRCVPGSHRLVVAGLTSERWRAFPTEGAVSLDPAVRVITSAQVGAKATARR